MRPETQKASFSVSASPALCTSGPLFPALRPLLLPTPQWNVCHLALPQPPRASLISLSLFSPCTPYSLSPSAFLCSNSKFLVEDQFGLVWVTCQFGKAGIRTLNSAPQLCSLLPLCIVSLIIFLSQELEKFKGPSYHRVKYRNVGFRAKFDWNRHSLCHILDNVFGASCITPLSLIFFTSEKGCVGAIFLLRLWKGLNLIM